MNFNLIKKAKLNLNHCIFIQSEYAHGGKKNSLLVFMCMINTVKLIFICNCKPDGSFRLLFHNMSSQQKATLYCKCWNSLRMTIKKAYYWVRRAWGGRCLLIESERFQHALQGVRVTQFTSDLSFEGHRTRKREREREK